MNTQMVHEMYVTKRNGEKVTMLFDKILVRLKTLGLYDPIFDRKLNVNYQNLVMKVINRLYDNIKTTEIDDLVAQVALKLMT